MNKALVVVARARLIALACAIAASTPLGNAGGSGLNTIVVLNQNRSNSIDLANFFCTQRAVPPENVLRISWPGDNISWTGTDFTNHLLQPLTAMLSSRGLASQIEYVVLSMDIPFETFANATNRNGTTSALFYGLKPDDNATPALLNPYAGTEAPFSEVQVASTNVVSFLTTMLTANTLAAAKELVTQGVRNPGAHPAQPVVLAKSSDPNRNFRGGLFDNAIFNSRIRGGMTIGRTNSDSPAGLSALLGYQTGLARFEVSTNTFVGGAIGDSATSFGGRIFGPNEQTNLLAFIHAGASGSYGTVAEPLADPEKFPNPMVYFYQSRGFSLAESYYQSLRKPYLGLIVGEPLSAPFAVRGHAAWNMVASNLTLAGTAQLSVSFVGHDSSRPLDRVDLFVDGRFYRTLTNLAPRAGNLLTLKLNGYPLYYAVPTNASLTTIASNLAALINDPGVTNATGIRARSFGDRIELQADHASLNAHPFYVVDASAAATNGATYRARYLPVDFPPDLASMGVDNTGAYRLLMKIPTPLPYLLEASTNLSHWTPIFTNRTPGLIEYRDLESTLYARRFYRIVGPPPTQLPSLRIQETTNQGDLLIRAESQPGQPCALLASTNLLDWTALVTNESGGVLDYLATPASPVAGHFFRAWLATPPQPLVSVTHPAPDATLIRVDQPAQPFIVERSTNGLDWVALATNFAFREIQVETQSDTGTASLLTTALHAARPTLQTSTAFGIQSYTFLAAMMTNGAWVEFVFNTTNGGSVTVAATNATSGGSVTNLAFDLFNRINAAPLLQGSTGVVAEDYFVNAGGQAKFNLRARSPGQAAAQLGVQANVSGYSTGVAVSPGTYRTLTRNLDDLRSRNHLYVTAGRNSLDVTFALDTLTLADGFHELTAVAYEGSNVRSQTHKTIGVQVQNTSLVASLGIAVTNLNVASNFTASVSANTSAVAEILLFTTGGLLAGVTNQSSAFFPVNGSFLGAGEHPFYALVTTTNGVRYRTATQKVTLSHP